MILRKLSKIIHYEINSITEKNTLYFAIVK